MRCRLREDAVAIPARRGAVPARLAPLAARLAVALAAALFPAAPAAAQDALVAMREAARETWGRATLPAAGPARSIGGAGLGCLAGAEALPAEGPGWLVVRRSRNRFWGTPLLVDTIARLAGRARAAGLPPLRIGDMSQPRGGPMTFGHGSHQTGLDVDVWLDLSGAPLPPAARESVQFPSLVLPGGAAVDPERWRPAHATLIRLAAEQPEVDRIFVNPAIKRRLCGEFAGAAWLRRVRPWYGHDSHMHVRLRCPAGDAGCEPQAPVPAGDGCGTALDWWFSPASRAPATRPPGPPPRLPAACAGVLAAP
ncbi:penicillin-insensitive murein endopeptidase [Roseomonas sp. NAR14]|uniref:Penicillin-insensitive murein endopeptidase n=1 Tax=Roseomonas acroporae TaxID=2937791 RepID=A0A9X2BUV7_9PROT|nr:penicillin-insensitive murein endopeptidase [Roseomonas acroporae]MCK8783359.1 penicillin-insensitive murein endopeptidase [Roseomonas acroporae]